MLYNIFDSEWACCTTLQPTSVAGLPMLCVVFRDSSDCEIQIFEKWLLTGLCIILF